MYVYALLLLLLNCQSTLIRFFSFFSISDGSVHVWRHRATKALYSVKVCSKDVLKAKSSVHTVIRELACSLAVDSPWVERYEWVTIDKEVSALAVVSRYLLWSPGSIFQTNRYYLLSHFPNLPNSWFSLVLFL